MIYGYVRVSTAKQLEGNSFEEQTNTILSKYSEAKIVYEQASGAEERPIFLKLLEDAKNGYNPKEDESDYLVNHLKCTNKKCISQIEQELDHKFTPTDKKGVYRCLYCESEQTV